MDTQLFANVAFLLLGIICTTLAIRVFFVYVLSHSDMLLFLILTPQIFNPGLVALAIAGPGMRIIGYTTLLIAYSVD